MGGEQYIHGNILIIQKQRVVLANIATNSVAIETAQLVKLSIEFHLKYGGKNNHKKIVRIFASHVTLNLTTNCCHGFKMFNNFFLAKKTQHELKTLHYSRYSCLLIVHTSYAKSSTFSLQTIHSLKSHHLGSEITGNTPRVSLATVNNNTHSEPLLVKRYSLS